MKEGQRQEVSRRAEKVIQAIQHPTTPRIFTRQQVQALCPDVAVSGITQTLIKLADEGQIRRVTRKGRFPYFRKLVNDIRTALPKSVVAEKVWEVLLEARQANSWVSLPDVTERVSILTKHSLALLRHPVYQCLARWYRSGYLERMGKPMSYTYQLKPGFTERPILVAK